MPAYDRGDYTNYRRLDMAGKPNNVVPQEEAYKYRFKAPTFTGKEDVK